MNEVIGYARAFTGGHDLGLQLDALQAAGVKRVFKEVGSGSLRSRPQLDACPERLGDGDTLIVWRLDRLGRSPRHLLAVSRRAQRTRSRVPIADRSDRHDDRGGPAAGPSVRGAGRVTPVVGSGAHTRWAGSRAGNRPEEWPARRGDQPQAGGRLAMRDQGDLTLTQIAEELGVSPASVYRRLAPTAKRPRSSTVRRWLLNQRRPCCGADRRPEACSFGGGSTRISLDGSCDTQVP
jgi:hypothetical protein